MRKNVIRRFIDWYKRPGKSYFEDLFESLIFVIIPVVFLLKTFLFGLYQVPTCSMETTMLVGERFLADKFTPIFSKPKRGEIISFNDPTYKYSNNWLINLYEQYISFSVVNWTKRVIAVPGDHIVGKIEDGKPVVYLNGKKLDEPYLNKWPVMRVIKPTSSRGRMGVCGDPVLRSYDPSKSYNDQPFYRFDALEVATAKKYYGNNTIHYPATPAHDCYGHNKDIFDVHLGPNQYWVMGDNRQGSADSRDWGILDLNKVLFHGRILFRIWSVDSDESWAAWDLIKHPIDFFKRVRWSRFFDVLH